MNKKGLRVEWVDVVDGNNQVVGVAERAKVRRENLCHRASYILVLDEADRILVQRRTLSKDFCPGMLDACAGGVVTTGEQMEPSARRELAEELGIRDVPLQAFGDFYAEGEGYRVWGGLFSAATAGRRGERGVLDEPGGDRRAGRRIYPRLPARHRHLAGAALRRTQHAKRAATGCPFCFRGDVRSA